MPRDDVYGTYSKIARMTIGDPFASVRPALIRDAARKQYAAELAAQAPTIPDADVGTLVRRYSSRYPSCASARSYREIVNALVRTVGHDEFRRLLTTDAQLRAAYAAS